MYVIISVIMLNLLLLRHLTCCTVAPSWLYIIVSWLLWSQTAGWFWYWTSQSWSWTVGFCLESVKTLEFEILQFLHSLFHYTFTKGTHFLLFDSLSVVLPRFPSLGLKTILRSENEVLALFWGLVISILYLSVCVLLSWASICCWSCALQSWSWSQLPACCPYNQHILFSYQHRTVFYWHNFYFINTFSRRLLQALFLRYVCLVPRETV